MANKQMAETPQVDAAQYQLLLEQVSRLERLVEALTQRDEAHSLALASVESLARDWLSPEEDEDWADLLKAML